MSIRPVQIGFAIALCTSSALAQQDNPPPSTLTITTRIVAVDAVVHNPDGDLLRNLDKDAFTLRVDGKPTDIRYFNRDNDLPLTIGLMVDTSESQSVYFDEEALSSENFFTNILTHPKDSALVVRFDTRIITLQKMTSRLTELHNALRQLDYLHTESDAVHSATLLYDAICNISKSVTSDEPGRRALVILTDGDDHGSRICITPSDAIHQAQLAGVAVYSVIYTNEMIGGKLYPQVPSLGPSPTNIMQLIAKSTGGRSFIVGAGTPIAQIFEEIERELRSQYRFGFTPLPSKSGKFHSIDIRTADKHQTIQARSGYFTPE